LTRLLSIAGWKRLAVTALCLAAWRGLEQIAVPSLNASTIAARLQLMDTSTFFHAIGGGMTFARYSIVALGVQPYINALIVVTLFRVISVRVRTIENEPDGPMRLLRWTRALTVLLAMGQAYGWTILLQVQGSLPEMDWSTRLVVILAVTGGTMVLVLLGEVLDEVGLGFGNGAVLLYALGPVAIEFHRLATMAAASPSFEALYRPLGVWTIFSIGVVAASVAVLLAVRRISSKKGENPVELRILLSGVLRPPMFATGVLFLPVILANYVSVENPGIPAWVNDHLTSYGTNPWTNTAYTVVNVGLVIAFTYFVVAIDFDNVPLSLSKVFSRLTFVGGTFLALTVVVLPVLEWNASTAAGRGMVMSGFDVVLVTALIVFIARSLERSRELVTGPPILMGRVP
jgi:preprotein translocase subunit SecY